MQRGRKARDIDEYISWYPGEAGRRLTRIRQTIRKALPGSSEKISYDIPTATIDGRPVLYFAAFAKHLSVYPAPRGAPEFADELARYAGGKGTMQIPHDAEVDYDLIARIARHHADRVQGRGSKKTGAKKAGAKKTGAKKAGRKAR